MAFKTVMIAFGIGITVVFVFGALTAADFDRLPAQYAAAVVAEASEFIVVRKMKVGISYQRVIIPATRRDAGGQYLQPPRLALNWVTELGNNPTNRPLAIGVTENWMDNITERSERSGTPYPVPAPVISTILPEMSIQRTSRSPSLISFEGPTY